MSKHIDYVAPPFRLANQITMVMGGTVLLFIVVQGFVMAALMQRTLDETVEKDQVAHTQGAAYTIDQYLTMQQERLASISILVEETSKDADENTSETVDENTDKEDTPASLPEIDLLPILKRTPDLLEVAIVNKDNDLVALQGQDNRSWYDTSIPKTQWFQERTVHIEWRIARGDNAILIGYPLDDTYTAVGYFSPEPVETILKRFKVDRNEILSLWDSDDRRLLSSADPPSHSDTFRAYSLLHYTNWQVASEIPDNVAHSEINELGLVLVALCALWITTAILMGRILTRQITIPMNSLISMVRRLEAGVYTLPIKAYSESEIGILATAFDRLREVIAEREAALENANHMLKLRSDDLENLSRQTIAVEEEERRRVSRELHDSLGQTLAALKMNLDVAQRLDDTQRVGELLQAAGKITANAMDEVHRISQNLRPTILDDLGLKEALEWHIDQHRQHYDIDVDYDFSAMDGIDLSIEARITAYRFLQEALNNIQKHANASQVIIKTLLKGYELIIGIRDNGKGFDPYKQKYMSHHLPLGLTGLEERLLLVGGTLEIRSAPGQGTTLVATLPILK